MVEDRFLFFFKVKIKFNSFPTWFVHLSKTSSLFQVSSLSESEESQDSSDSIGSSQKTHGILARRPSYRLVLMYQILCVLYYHMSLNGVMQSRLHQEGTCVYIRRHVLREIGLSQVMKGPCCCAEEEFRLTFWQSIRCLCLLLVNFNSNLKGL